MGFENLRAKARAQRACHTRCHFAERFCGPKTGKREKLRRSAFDGPIRQSDPGSFHTLCLFFQSLSTFTLPTLRSHSSPLLLGPQFPSPTCSAVNQALLFAKRLLVLVYLTVAGGFS